MTALESYGALCAAFYDADKPAPPAAELAFYRERLSARPGPVLEPMCGSGRFLLPLLHAGLDVWGFDAAPAMVQRCQARLSALGADTARVQLANFSSFTAPADQRFAQAFIAAGSIALLSATQAAQALRSLRRWLSDDAPLLIEFWLPDGADAPWDAPLREVTLSDGVRIELRTRCTPLADGRTLQMDCEYTARSRDRQSESPPAQERECLMLRSYTRAEWRALVDGAGWQVAELIEAPFGDERLLAVLLPRAN
jgi:hypothetical protein